ncbi:hypothetical protein ABZ958_36365 [Streptomyces sp. NPDC046237]|uniref:hypothetical protein n=1 Tax=Streptomyces sp. NPDC046237 TaxID=3154914 RepID=UPI0033C4B768
MRGRQVLVGDFAPEDCNDYLPRRLEADGTPLIPEAVRQVITARSHGLPLYLDLAVMRFLELRRTGRTPEPADFEHDFPALIARPLADLTPDERHLLRSVSILDAFDAELATKTAGLTHQAAARRLIERPFINENPFGLWPYYLHGLIRSTIRGADDQTDDRWTTADWRAAAVRALAALGKQWTAGPDRDRLLLVGCLRQGLALARDFRLDLGWLTEAAWAYVSDSVWEPVAPAARTDRADASAGAVLETAADVLAELLSTLARRQQRPLPHRRPAHRPRRHRAAAHRTAREGYLLPGPKPTATSESPITAAQLPAPAQAPDPRTTPPVDRDLHVWHAACRW